MKKTRSVYYHITPVRTGPFRRQDTPGVVHIPIHDEMHGFDVMSLDPDASPDQIAAFLAPRPTETFESYVSEMRQRLNAELAADGWPPGDRYVLNSGDTWCLAPESVVSNPFGEHPEYADAKLTMGSLYIRERCAAFSREWFLAQISEALTHLEAATGDTRSWAIFHLARLVEIYEHRAYHSSVQVAFKNWRGASLGGRARAAVAKARSEKVLTEMQKYVDKGHSIARAAAFCASRGIGTSQAANVQLWQRRR